MRLTSLIRLLLLGLTASTFGCSHHPASSPTPAPPPAWVDEVRKMVGNGDYIDSLAKLDEVLGKAASPAGSAEALYLRGYIAAWCRSQYKSARPSLQKLVDADPHHPLAPPALRLLADCYYFDRRYELARRNYAALLDLYGEEGYGAYALLQKGNCYMLEGVPGDALTAWRDAVEKYPKDGFSVKAQLQVANVYIGLEEPQMAKPELSKLSSLSKDEALQTLIRGEMKKLDAMGRSDAGRLPAKAPAATTKKRSGK